jgi:hypothetical protein
MVRPVQETNRMKLPLIAPLAALAVLAVPAYAASSPKPFAAKTVKHVKKTNKKKDGGTTAPAPAN